ncbi:isopentenyl-diphosphate Delta-isomerase [Hyphobacterium sp. CCMP332]|nr:isopentenyl-diphosphate Delta-isomerase [Hyphobacterium sp. CCMP332]
MIQEHVILVDESDNELGTMEKIEAHKKGVLHRAFSVCIFNDKGEMLIQKRAADKYHSPGLWTNACCSHPRKGENIHEAAKRRLEEEMGIQTTIEKAFSFLYKTRLEKGMIEHELDHVLIGKYNEEPNINLAEVEDWKYMKLNDIQESIMKKPEMWTEWFKIIMPKISLYYSPIFV